jgi:hypothetical protein
MWPFSKRSAADKAVEEMPRAINAACEMWLDVYSKDFARNVEFLDLVAMFVDSLSNGLRTWPAFKSAPDRVFLLIAVKGIEKSRTHLRMQLETLLEIEIPEPFERTNEEELEAVKEMMVDCVSSKWTHYVNAINFGDDVELAERIARFRGPFLESFKKEFPMFANISVEQINAILTLGIAKTGSASPSEIGRALRRTS